MTDDKPGPAFHEKKDKNKKDYNIGGGEKIRMNKAKKYKKAIKRGPKKKKIKKARHDVPGFFYLIQTLLLGETSSNLPVGSILTVFISCPPVFNFNSYTGCVHAHGA